MAKKKFKKKRKKKKKKFYDQSNEPVIIFIFKSLRIIQLGDMMASAKTGKKKFH